MHLMHVTLTLTVCTTSISVEAGHQHLTTAVSNTHMQQKLLCGRMFTFKPYLQFISVCFYVWLLLPDFLQTSTDYTPTENRDLAIPQFFAVFRKLPHAYSEDHACIQSQ